MKIRAFPILAAALVAAACGKQAPSGSQVSSPAPPQAHDSRPAKPEASRLVIADGVVVPFRHIVRSRKDQAADDASGAAVSHVLRIEFQGVDGAHAAAALRKAFVRKGYKVAEISDEGGVATFIARSEEQERVRYVVTPAGPAIRVPLLRSDSQGMVTFSWKD